MAEHRDGSSGTNDPSVEEEAIAVAFFDRGAEPVPDEAEQVSLDEWSAVSLTARLYAPERANHLGGPQERIIPAMPARTVAIRRRAVSEDPEPDTQPRSPSDEERQRTARRNTEAQVQQQSPMLVLGGMVLIFGLLTFFVFLFGNRLFS
jgi:hypothetical protein